jgi:hypothetical protein
VREREYSIKKDGRRRAEGIKNKERNIRRKKNKNAKKKGRRKCVKRGGRGKEKEREGGVPEVGGLEGLEGQKENEEMIERLRKEGEA